MAGRRRQPVRLAPEGKDMREYIKEQADLAQAYADDGAYNSAGRVLRELAMAVMAHAASIGQW